MPAFAYADQTLVLRSGNGSVGSPDSIVHVLSFGATGDITPAPGDFTAAQTAPFASVVAPVTVYIASLPSDPVAKWVAAGPDRPAGSALYAIPFVLTDSAITSASLDLPFAVDNFINGVYLNEQPISGNSRDGDYHSEFRFFRADVASLLRPASTNWLYLNVSDYGVIAALIFSATIDTVSPVVGIRPAQGGNTGRVTTTIVGSGFLQGAGVKLVRLDDPDISAQTLTVSSDGLTITASFDLTGKAAGVWDVVVSEPDGGSTVIARGFHVIDGGVANLVLDVVGPARVRAGREATFTAVVRNEGLVDAGVFLAALGANPVAVGAAAAGTAAPLADTITLVPNLPPGAMLPVPLPVPFPGGPNCASIDGQLLEGLTPQAAIRALRDCLEGNGLLGRSHRKESCCELVEELIKKLQGEDPGLREMLVERWGEQAVSQFVRDLIQLSVDYECDSSAALTTSMAVRVVPRVVSAPQETAGTLSVCPVTSWDPNDKVGPAGAGEPRWTGSDVPVPYTVFFENVATATAPAQNVVVTDQLDSNLDVSTFALGDIRLGATTVAVAAGAQNLVTTVDLRPAHQLLVKIEAELDTASRIVTWRFTSLDPATGQPPQDPLAGFLPPNVAPPEGEGAISFDVLPKAGLATGTQIRNAARIVFDANPSIDTPEWLTTVDNAAPQSHVAPLAATQDSANILVAWSGVDEGSGIRDYSVFVSENGTPYTKWLADTTETSGEFTGRAGYEYAFYSVARDRAGLVEAPPIVADAIVADATTIVLVASTPTTTAPRGATTSTTMTQTSVHCETASCLARAVLSDPACAGVPMIISRELEQAAAAAERAATATGNARKKSLRTARRALALANRKAVGFSHGKRPKIGRDCALAIHRAVQSTRGALKVGRF